jgi:hypothetical protein
LFAHELCKMLTAIIIVARVQPGTSKGITDLLLPHPSSGLNNFAAVPLVSSSLHNNNENYYYVLLREVNKRMRSRSLPSGLYYVNEKKRNHLLNKTNYIYY